MTRMKLGMAVCTPMAVIAMTLGLGACSGDDDGHNVGTDKGVVSGVETTAMLAYRSIPYAAPPVDALRWKAPQAAAAWAG